MITTSARGVSLSLSLSLSLYARREEVGVSRISPYLTIDRRSKLLFASRWAGGPLSNSLLLSLSLSTILPSLFLSKRSLPKLFPGTKMRAHHRGRLLFCPRNSHFDQFEFFVGAATVDFTTETSSLLSPARCVLLSLSLPLSLSSLSLSLSPSLPLVDYLSRRSRRSFSLVPCAHTLNLASSIPRAPSVDIVTHSLARSCCASVTSGPRR